MILSAHDFTQATMIQSIANHLQTTNSMQPAWVKTRLDAYLQKIHDQTLSDGRICINLHILDIFPSDQISGNDTSRSEVLNNIICYYYLVLASQGYTLQITSDPDLILSAFLSTADMSNFHMHVNTAIKLTTGKRRPLTHGI